MGYESTLFVVSKSDQAFINNGKYFGEVVASVDLKCCGSEVSVFRDYPESDCYIYIGNEQIHEDKYGEPLKEIPVDDAIHILQKGVASENSYWRYSVALQLLNGFVLAGVSNNFVVLHYGH